MNTNRTLIVLFLLLPGLVVQAAEEQKQLSISDGERQVLTYNAAYLPSPDPSAPWFGRSGFIHPVYTPKGRVVTDPFPEDHLHQHALMFAWTSAAYDGKKVDFWNSKKKLGRVEHVKTHEASDDSIKVQLAHVVTRKKPVTGSRPHSAKSPPSTFRAMAPSNHVASR